MRKLAAAVAAFFLLIWSCSRDSSGDDPPPLPVSIDTPAGDVDILVGGTVNFSGDVSGGKAPYTYLWTFPGGTPSTSTEEDPGDVQFNTAGVQIVTFQAWDADGLTGVDTVAVRVYKILQSISVSPKTADLNQGSTLDFSVTATFTDSTTLDVTTLSSYTSQDTTRIRMTGNRALALVGPTLASVDVYVEYTHGVAGNEKTDTATITTKDPVVRYTKTQIQARWDALKAVESAVSYQSPPTMTVDGLPLDEGVLKPQLLTDGANRVNMYRYLAGLPDGLTVNGAQTVSCQNGAHVLTMLDLQGYTNFDRHNPLRPDGVTVGSLYDINTYLPGEDACGKSNILWGWFTGIDISNVPTPPECVDSWMDDAGNPTTLGHRRWILHPELKSTTFGMIWAAHGTGPGQHTHFNCLMYVVDLTAPTPSFDCVAYPSEGWYPKQCFEDPADGDRVLWSFSANSALYDLDSQTSVTVVRQSDGAVLPVTATVLLPDYGITPTIAFNPGESTLNETYYVTIGDIKLKSNGSRFSYSYWVSFYNLFP